MGEQLPTALVAAAVSAVVSVAVALAQLRQGRVSHRFQAQRDITAKYDRMIDYRLQRPEVLSLARRWSHGCFAWIYDHTGPDGDAWAIYYGYIELITFYCSAVLRARAHGLIDADVYESQHEPLIKLLLAEHYPVLSVIIRPRGYVTKYLVEHVADLRRCDWDWEAAYGDLTG
ncbi:MAG: hypothetical protein WDA27_13430 [Actinomycetota bacterium]